MTGEIDSLMVKEVFSRDLFWANFQFPISNFKKKR
jgi:hypothetical protein